MHHDLAYFVAVSKKTRFLHTVHNFALLPSCIAGFNAGGARRRNNNSLRYDQGQQQRHQAPMNFESTVSQDPPSSSTPAHSKYSRALTPNTEIGHSKEPPVAPVPRSVTPGPDWGKYHSDDELDGSAGIAHFRQPSYLSAMDTVGLPGGAAQDPYTNAAIPPVEHVHKYKDVGYNGVQKLDYVKQTNPSLNERMNREDLLGPLPDYLNRHHFDQVHPHDGNQGQNLHPSSAYLHSGSQPQGGQPHGLPQTGVGYSRTTDGHPQMTGGHPQTTGGHSVCPNGNHFPKSQPKSVDRYRHQSSTDMVDLHGTTSQGIETSSYNQNTNKSVRLDFTPMAAHNSNQMPAIKRTQSMEELESTVAPPQDHHLPPRSRPQSARPCERTSTRPTVDPFTGAARAVPMSRPVSVIAARHSQDPYPGLEHTNSHPSSDSSDTSSNCSRSDVPRTVLHNNKKNQKLSQSQQDWTRPPTEDELYGTKTYINRKAVENIYKQYNKTRPRATGKSADAFILPKQQPPHHSSSSSIDSCSEGKNTQHSQPKGPVLKEVLKVDIPDNVSRDSGYRSGGSGGDRNSSSSNTSVESPTVEGLPTRGYPHMVYKALFHSRPVVGRQHSNSSLEGLGTCNAGLGQQHPALGHIPENLPASIPGQCPDRCDVVRSHPAS